MTGFARPRDLDALAEVVSGFDGSITYIAGGTDLIIAQNATPWADLVIDISGTQGLDFVKVSDGAIHIGAATTMTGIAVHSGIRKYLPALAQGAAQVGAVQIRNRATIGGNIASAVPAGDLLPVLKCLEAEVQILRRDGHTEQCKFDEVVVGRGETSLNNGDLITAVILPLQYGANRISAFAKIGMREVLTIARLNMAIQADFDPSNARVRDIRIVAGAIGPLPLRLHAVEAAFLDRPVDQSLADDFLEALTVAVDSAIPGRYSQPYKRQAIAGLGLDLLQDLFGHVFTPEALMA